MAANPSGDGVSLGGQQSVGVEGGDGANVLSDTEVSQGSASKQETPLAAARTRQAKQGLQETAAPCVSFSLTAAKGWKRLGGPQQRKGEQTWSIHPVAGDSAVPTRATAWVDLEGTRLSEVSRSQKHQHGKSPFYQVPRRVRPTDTETAGGRSTAGAPARGDEKVPEADGAAGAQQRECTLRR